MEKNELMYQEMKTWFDEHEDPVETYETMLEAKDRSFVTVFKTCSEILG